MTPPELVATTPVRVGTETSGWTIRVPHHRAVRWLVDPLFENARLMSMWQHLQGVTGPLFDIGSEQGDMSALFALWGHDVVLVEPNPLAWPSIRLTFAANSLDARVAATYVGFAGRHGDLDHDPLTVRPGPVWPSCALDRPPVPDAGFAHLAEQDDIPRLSIDALSTAVAAPAAITIDVEGAELEVLRGAEHTLTTHRPLVWVSVHPGFLRHHFGQEPRDVYNYLDSLDYRCWHLADDHEVHILAEPR